MEKLGLKEGKQNLEQKSGHVLGRKSHNSFSLDQLDTILGNHLGVKELTITRNSSARRR